MRKTIGRVDQDVDRFRKIVSESKSVAEVARKLGYKKSGEIHKWLKLKFSKYNIDVSHFCGASWSKGKTRFSDSRINNQACFIELPWEKAFCVGSSVRNETLMKRLVLSGKTKYECYKCGIKSWNGKPIRLHLDHINGINTDNREENLRIVCPNCDSQSETYSVGKRLRRDSLKWWDSLSTGIPLPKKVRKTSTIKRIKIIKNCACGSVITGSGKTGLCRTCSRIKSRKVERPSKIQLLNDLSESNFLAIGRKYGVSDNAVRKWLKLYERDQVV